MGQREHRIDPHVIDSSMSTEDTSPEAILFAESGLTWEQAEDVMEALDGLPEVQKAVLECLILGGMSKADTAEALGISRTYVYQLEEKALGRLADELAHLLNRD